MDGAPGSRAIEPAMPLSAPHADATSAIVRMSSRSWRCTLPLRGSGLSHKIVIGDGLGSPPRNR